VDIQKYLKTQLSTNPQWATKAMIRIFNENQTNDERTSEHTKYDNGIGFSGVDGEILSSFSKQVIGGRTLSPKQMAIVMKKMHRYWKQIMTMIPSDKMMVIEQKILEKKA